MKNAYSMGTKQRLKLQSKSLPNQFILSNRLLVPNFLLSLITSNRIAGVAGSLERLTCRQRMKIAIGIGQGLRYMHEECPGGPIVHGDLRPCNIFLGRNNQPLVTNQTNTFVIIMPFFFFIPNIICLLLCSLLTDLRLWESKMAEN